MQRDLSDRDDPDPAAGTAAIRTAPAGHRVRPPPPASGSSTVRSSWYGASSGSTWPI